MNCFVNYFEIATMYTEYCMDCEEKGIKPLNEKEWFEKWQWEVE